MSTYQAAESADARPDAFAGKALAASAIGYAMDGFDLLILGFMLRVISADLGLTPPQAGSLVTWTLIGAVAGGILFGILSDNYGRVRVLTWTILIFAGFTGLCAFTQGYWDLLVYRTIAGLGLGGEFGIGMALAAEAWPAGKRARVSSYVGLVASRSTVGSSGYTTAASSDRLARHVRSGPCCPRSWPSSSGARSMNRRSSSKRMARKRARFACW